MLEKIKKLAQEGHINQEAEKNLVEWLGLKNIPKYFTDSINELVNEEQWEEINNRFFKNISFGTGGIRGRTISKWVTKSERGDSNKDKSPKFAMVGTNALNEMIVTRATKALFDHAKEKQENENIFSPPTIVIAHDVRHFSKQFSQIIAQTWSVLGGIAYQFDGPRSTPHLSFTIRSRGADAGVVVTASHNPYHDNGFKAYSSDGSQISGEEAESVVRKYKDCSWEDVCDLLQNGEKPEDIYLPKRDDLFYLSEIENAVLNLELIKTHSPKTIFTPIHGTGAISSVPALWEVGANLKIFDSQNDFDADFSSVNSPNPENQEALSLAIKFAQKAGGEVVLGTDPDCDRVGIAVKSGNKFECLSGNQVGAIIAEYRFHELKRRQILKAENAKGFCLLKTLVTTNLLEKIAHNYGAECVNTPTGFKWMASKLNDYESKAVKEIYENEGIGLNYDKTDIFTRIEILSRYSKYAVLCAEESYGYLPLDTIRDKDGNASSLAIVEALSFIKSIDMTPLGFLDELYKRYGYHLEETKNVYLDGATGSEKISKIMESFRKSPPSRLGSLEVEKIIDFSKPDLLDEEGQPFAKENFLIMQMNEGFRVAIRPSGTEPKLKFYIFGEGSPNPQSLSEEKAKLHEMCDEVSKFLKTEVDQRSN